MSSELNQVDLVKHWHPTKNSNLKPETLSKGSNKKVWWKAECGHEWETSVNSYIKSIEKCPFCSNRKLLVGFNDLKTTHPVIASQWHPTKNGTLMPENVLGRSSKKVWWLFEDCKHEYFNSPGSRTVTKISGILTTCPYCEGRQILVGFNDLKTTHPEIFTELHPSKNNTIQTKTLSKGSNKKVWWLGKCGHEWKATVLARCSGEGQGCAVCRGLQIQVGVNDLNTVNPEIAKEWHPTLNSFPSTQVTANSGKKVWWLCSQGHEWEAKIYSRNKGNNCPKCAKKQLSHPNRGKNFVYIKYPEYEKLFMKTNDKKFTEITTGEKTKYWWQCEQKHVWEATPARMVRSPKCPICSNKTILKGINDLATTHPTLATEWHPTLNKHLTPNDVTYGSDAKVWWVCEKGHEWETKVCWRLQGLQGCKKCRQSGGEKKLLDFVSSLNYKTFEQTKNIISPFELDIWVPEKRIAIEYNGLYWHSEKFKDKNYHYDKWLACKEQGVQLIQVWEDDWKLKPELVKQMLAHKLGVSSQPKMYARKTNVVELSYRQVVDFLEDNHIQGVATGSYYTGLVDKQDNIVAVLVSKWENNNKTLNIIRYATSMNVVGGFTKLLKFVEKAYKPERFITFSDHCVSDGGLYANNGFVADKELRTDYMYIVNGERKHKFGYRLKRFQNDPELKYEAGLSEHQLALLNGLYRVYDAGKTRWVKTVS